MRTLSEQDNESSIYRYNVPKILDHVGVRASSTDFRFRSGSIARVDFDKRERQRRSHGCARGHRPYFYFYFFLHSSSGYDYDYEYVPKETPRPTRLRYHRTDRRQQTDRPSLSSARPTDANRQFLFSLTLFMIHH